MRLALLLLLGSAALAEESQPSAKPLVASIEPRRANWRERVLDAYQAEQAKLVPCRIVEAGGRVAIGFAGQDKGRLCIATNLYPQPYFIGCQDYDRRREYWHDSSFGKQPVTGLALDAWGVLRFVYTEKSDAYEPQSTVVLRAGRSNGFAYTGRTYGPPKRVALAIAFHPQSGRFEVEHNPKSQTLAYRAWKKGHEPTPIPMGADEVALAITVTRHGVIHAVTQRDSKLYHRSNENGEPRRSLLVPDSRGQLSTAVVTRGKAGPAVLYADTHTRGLVLLERSGKGWKHRTIDATEHTGKSCAGRFDRNGSIHVCYSAGHELRYATNKSGSWRAVVLAAGSAIDGCDLAIDRKGFVHVCYGRRADGKVRYLTNRPPEDADAKKDDAK